ncbi:MAG: iron ABC transporter permease [Planctomycetes bacterium]|nr:iron ABC transporter permease [Planctomycetota bacterium]
MKKTAKKHPAWYGLLVCCSILIACFIILPLYTLLFDSFQEDNRFTFEHYLKLFSGNSLLALWNSIWVSLLSTFTAACIGIPLALLLHSREFFARRFFALIALAPLTLPPVVGMFAFWLLIGDVGLIPSRFGEWFHPEGRPLGAITGIAAVIVVHAYSFSVYFYAMCAAALQRRDHSLLEAAHSLGAGHWQSFSQVTLPYLMPHLIGAAALSFMISMGSFSAPYILANGSAFLSVQIYEVSFAESTYNPDFGLAAALSIVGALVCTAFLLISNRFQTNASAARGARSSGVIPANDKQKIYLPIISAVAAFILLLPHLCIVLIAVSDFGQWDSGLLPPIFTLANFDNIFSDSYALQPMANSAEHSSYALMACMLWCLLSALLIVRSGIRGSWILDVMMMLPLALPGTVIAFSLLRCFSSDNLIGLNLSNSLYLLPLAYCIRCLPLAIRPLVASLRSADPSHEEAARSLGAGPIRSFLLVSIPYLIPALIASALLVYVTCLGEFVCSLMIYKPDNLPIGVYIYQCMQGGLAKGAAYSVLLLILMMLIACVQRLLAKANP